MPDLTIKPNAGSGNKVIIQDQAGGAVVTTADSGATIASATLTSPTINSPTLAGTISSATLLPTADATQDLGSSAKRWNNIYTTDLHLANDRGNWTVIEEENYLTLRNNKTDKVYKLVMEEIV